MPGVRENLRGLVAAFVISVRVGSSPEAEVHAGPPGVVVDLSVVLDTGLCFIKKSLLPKKLKLAIAGSRSRKCSSSEW